MSSGDLRTGLRKLVHGENAMRNTALTGLAELLGTAFLVFLGCMGCVGSFGVSPPHLQITLTFGLAVMIVIQSFGHISQAHINPAITVGAVILGKKTIPEAVVYFTGQLIGAVLGYGLLKIVTPMDHLTSGGAAGLQSFCTTDLHEDITAIQGLLIEGLATAILMLIACGVWDRRNERNTDSVAIKFGLGVTALATAVGPYTGCSMNPARSLGPAIWNNYWSHHWIYWFGPIGGALFASFMYRLVFSPKEDEEETIPESVALNCVETHKTEQI